VRFRSVLALGSRSPVGRSSRGDHLALRAPRTLLRRGGLGCRHCRRCRRLGDCSCSGVGGCFRSCSLVGSTPDCDTRAAAGAALGGELILVLLARQRLLQVHVPKHEPHGKEEGSGDREPGDGDPYGRARPQRLIAGGIRLLISHRAARPSTEGNPTAYRARWIPCTATQRALLTDDENVWGVTCRTLRQLVPGWAYNI